MKQALVDTDILSLFLRGHPQVVRTFEAYLSRYDQINLSIITYYEILSGLEHRDAQKQLASFQQFVAHNTIILLTVESVGISAGIYAGLRARGEPLDDSDILIAGIAIANQMVLATHNRRHFARIEGLEIEDWSEDRSSKARIKLPSSAS